MNEPLPHTDDPLRELLAHPPDGFEVEASPQRLLLRFRQHGPVAPHRVRDNDLTLAVGILLGVCLWIGLGFSLIVVLPKEFVLETICAVSAGPPLLMLVIFQALRQPHTEIDLSGGELRINRWRRRLRDLHAVRYEYIRSVVNLNKQESHFVRIDGPDHAWRCSPRAGERTARWLADVIDVHLQRAKQDTA